MKRGGNTENFENATKVTPEALARIKTIISKLSTARSRGVETVSDSQQVQHAQLMYQMYKSTEKSSELYQSTERSYNKTKKEEDPAFESIPMSRQTSSPDAMIKAREVLQGALSFVDDSVPLTFGDKSTTAGEMKVHLGVTAPVQQQVVPQRGGDKFE